MHYCFIYLEISTDEVYDKTAIGCSSCRPEKEALAVRWRNGAECC